MKKIMLSIFLFCFTPIFSIDSENSVYAGIQTGTSNKTFNSTLDTNAPGLESGDEYSFSFNYFDAGIFADINFARFIINYSQTFSESKVTVDDGNSISKENYYISQKFIEPSILAKYPFKEWVPDTSIWPAAGISYSYLLDSSSKYNEDVKYEISDNSYFNTFWFSVALGVDYNLSTSMILTAYAGASICLNPDMRFKYYNKDTSSETIIDFKDEKAYKYIFNVGLGYKLR